MALLAAVLLAGCATPAQRLDERAAQLGFSWAVLQGAEFTHVVYRNAVAARGGLLHIYLEGDGTPWLNYTQIAADPTPRNPLVLALMAQDPAPSLYLGRPCYHGQSAPGCNPLLWTARRYGPEVVGSMAAALARRLEREDAAGLVLIGHSGGGTLAMLLAERFPQTRAVLTVAGNLDPDAWTEWHAYSPLTGSLNPAVRPPLPPGIVQLHYAGGRDDNVPARQIRAAARRQLRGAVRVIDRFDHVCCWQTAWPDILADLQARLEETQR